MDDRHIKFGIFLAPFHQNHENPTVAMERDMELLIWLDRLDYQEAWIGEHHSGGFEIIASPEIFIAAAAQHTRHIRLGTGVVSLPYHHPLMVADRMVQLDHMLRGRAMFGIGPGALSSDAFAMGIQPADQRRRMVESLDVIMPLLRGEQISAKTDWFTIDNARLQLRPYTRPHMEMAVASARSPVGAEAAGRYDLGMLAISGTGEDALAAMRANHTLYEQRAREYGNTPTRERWRLVSLYHLAESREQARRNVEFGLEPWLKYFREVTTFPVVPADVPDSIDFLIESGIALIGTPDDMIRRIESLWRHSGGFGGFLALANNWADWAETKRSYELMSRYVIPHFQGSTALRQQSYDYVKSNHERFAGLAGAAVQAEIDRVAAEKAAAEDQDAAE